MAVVVVGSEGSSDCHINFWTGGLRSRSHLIRFSSRLGGHEPRCRSRRRRGRDEIAQCMGFTEGPSEPCPWNWPFLAASLAARETPRSFVSKKKPTISMEHPPDREAGSGLKAWSVERDAGGVVWAIRLVPRG